MRWRWRKALEEKKIDWNNKVGRNGGEKGEAEGSRWSWLHREIDKGCEMAPEYKEKSGLFLCSTV